jgi:hypothetical protein
LACSGGGGGGGGTTTFSLAVTGNPTGARVFLNGQLVENPQRIVLPPGAHRIRVETTLSNGQVVAQEFTIVAGAIGSIQYDLSRYQIETNPATIEVWAGEQIPVAATLRDTQTERSRACGFRLLGARCELGARREIEHERCAHHGAAARRDPTGDHRRGHGRHFRSARLGVGLPPAAELKSGHLTAPCTCGIIHHARRRVA